MAKKNFAALSNTEVVNGRANMADKIEQERLELKKEIEKLMFKYAKATGYRKYAKRKHKVGEAPNDWKPRAEVKVK
jgi:hypothetical protein